MHPRQFDVLRAGAKQRTAVHGCRGSGGQLLPSLPAPRLHDGPPGAGGHAVTESVALRPTADIWLIRSFHVESFWPSRGADHLWGRPPDSALLVEIEEPCSKLLAGCNKLRAAPFGSGECISGDSVSCACRHDRLSPVTLAEPVFTCSQSTDRHKSPRWPRRRQQRRGETPSAYRQHQRPAGEHDHVRGSPRCFTTRGPASRRATVRPPAVSARLSILSDSSQPIFFSSDHRRRGPISLPLGAHPSAPACVQRRCRPALSTP